MTTDKRNMTAGHLLAFMTILIWGNTFISTKILLVDFTPVEILFFRFLIGYAALLLIDSQPIRFRSWREEMLFIGAGLCGVALYFLLENAALTYTLASNVGVIVSIAPFFTAVLAHFFLEGEKVNVQFMIGFVMALAGIMAIGFNGSVLLRLNPAGDILACLAPVVWAVYSVLMRKISALGYPTVRCTRKVFFYGLLLMVPALFLFPFRLGPERFYDLSNASNLLFLGLGASALCFATWNRAVGILGAVTTSIYIYIVPVITVASSALILHEKLTWATYLGTFLTLAGSYISERSRKRRGNRDARHAAQAASDRI
ncbi:DMT family transporter [Paenibacillus sp. MSJ-34]|uniref:DMT family transporter n=1 Tax=Paenibacillus sp. MSJ-34 TaxID=2841529 RepID=UPI001C107B5C|nr:DMT family transporter [Paenibacillus sp. MSJ-34]MBU5443583.1 DMT family transporter [Paenibacillus sp. MSJ-34]